MTILCLVLDFQGVYIYIYMLLIYFIGKSLPWAYHGHRLQVGHPHCLEDKRGHTPQGLPTWESESRGKRWDIYRGHDMGVSTNAGKTPKMDGENNGIPY